MTDAELVLRKLAILREHLGRARRRRPEQLDLLEHDDDRKDALAMSVMVALQEAIDVAFHIVVDEGIGVPSSNAEAFELLAKQGVLATPLASRLARAVGLRNRIAHGYASVDTERLWKELPDGLDDLEAYVVAVGRFLGK